MKKLLLTISLISLILCADDCTSKSESDCTSDSKCKWTAAKCSGDTGETCSAVKVEATCKQTEYPGAKTPCSFTDAVVEACTGTVKPCTELDSETKCGYVEGCSWSSTTCGGTGTSTCNDLKDATKCPAVGCSYTVPVSAKCEGDETCTSHTTNSGDCTGTTFTSAGGTCTWTAGSCSSSSSGGSGDSGEKFVNVSKFILAVFALIF